MMPDAKTLAAQLPDYVNQPVRMKTECRYLEAKNTNAPGRGVLVLVAERVGFEPTYTR